jgi:hypothetical protein
MSGRAFMLVTGDDGKFLAGIEKLIGTSIPEIALEGFAMEAQDAAEAAPTKSSRSRSRSPRSAREPAAPREPAPREPGRSSRPPARDHGPSRDRGEELAKRPPPRSRRRDEFDDDAEPEAVVGFGNRVPDFLRLPPRPGRNGSKA